MLAAASESLLVRGGLRVVSPRGRNLPSKGRPYLGVAAVTAAVLAWRNGERLAPRRPSRADWSAFLAAAVLLARGFATANLRPGSLASGSSGGWSEVPWGGSFGDDARRRRGLEDLETGSTRGVRRVGVPTHGPRAERACAGGRGHGHRTRAVVPQGAAGGRRELVLLQQSRTRPRHDQRSRARTAENGVPANDRASSRLTWSSNSPESYQTYDVALAILFLAQASSRPRPGRTTRADPQARPTAQRAKRRHVGVRLARRNGRGADRLDPGRPVGGGCRAGRLTTRTPQFVRLGIWAAGFDANAPAGGPGRPLRGSQRDDGVGATAPTKGHELHDPRRADGTDHRRRPARPCREQDRLAPGGVALAADPAFRSARKKSAETPA